jgi:hypothetical protein
MTNQMLTIQAPELPELQIRRDVTSTTDPLRPSVPARYGRLVQALRASRRVDWEAESTDWAEQSSSFAEATFEAGAEAWPAQ